MRDFATTDGESPLQELTHEPVPGYRRAFVIVFALLGLYLAVILITSPGHVKHGDDHGSGKGDAQLHQSTHSKETDPSAPH